MSLRSRSSAFKDIFKKPFNRSRGTPQNGSGGSPTSTPPTPTRASTEEPPDDPQQVMPPTQEVRKEGNAPHTSAKTNGMAEMVRKMRLFLIFRYFATASYILMSTI